MFSTVMNRLNERRAAELEGEAADSGFTLIELMVVLLILAILLAIAIPTFLGVTNSANDRASQSNLNTALTDGKSIYESGGQSYGTTASLVSSLSSNEPALSALLTSSTSALKAGQIQVYVSKGGNSVAYFTLAKKTGVCWFLADVTTTVSTTETGTAGSPWNGTNAIPSTPGEHYGAYNTNNGNTSCGAAFVGGLATAATQSTTAFPPAPAA